MRTISRTIVGAFIFSSDGKVLLGHNKKGGVYQGMLVVPGGGIEEGETQVAALKREILEETGIDVSNAQITPLEMVEFGESEKTLRETKEVVLVKMEFYDFVVRLPMEASMVRLIFEDDFAHARWYTADQLQNESIGPNSKLTLQKIGFLHDA
ncbi:MAG TPA: NUDIX hydrolase [Candidatus Saccharimonadales bacterium]